jgi:hypothetical protein
LEFTADLMLGHYRLVEKIGEGGMGVVWRALDTTLDRQAAIKILPEIFASDQDRLLRFEREAKVLASLNHPGIASIFGLHETEGVRFLAMEYVPGEDLAARLSRGPLAVEEALEIGRRIAEALEAAHEIGVVHRDLKPANVMITEEGQVKLLDFGLAKALGAEAAAGSEALSLSPTVTSPATMLGTILGTAAYMSPEQARGGAVDKRADIWAFGCLLLEMLTGKRTFEGSTVTDTLAAVLRAEIDLDDLPRDVPPSVRRLLERCLDRDPRTRLRDAGEARIVLEEPGQEAVDGERAAGPRASRLPWIIAAVVAALLGVAVGRLLLSPATDEMPVLSFRITGEDPELRTGSIALSPDGRNLVMLVEMSGGMTELWLRPLGESRARPLPGSRGGLLPFWSPDSRELAFFADGQLLRLPLDGTSPRVVCEAANPLGGTWNEEDVILFGQTGKGLHRVDASGGTPVEMTTVRADEEEHAWPVFLPDDDHFLFLADATTVEAHRLMLGRLSSAETTILRTGVRSSLGYDPRAGVLFGDRGQLLAFPLDLRGRKLVGGGVLVADRFTPVGSNHPAPFTVSRNGILALQRASRGIQMLKVDQNGELLRQFGDLTQFANPAVSPDGRRALVEIAEGTDEQFVWLIDLDRGVQTPVSQQDARSDSGTWSADGGTIYFDSDFDPDRIWVAYKRAADGGGQPQRVGAPDGARETSVLDTSPDGKWLLVFSILEERNADLFLGRLESDGLVSEWINWTETPRASENFGAFSPDGQFITYASDESGKPEVYLAPVEGGQTAKRWQLSTGGGVEPRFTPDGRSIFYRSLRDRVTSVSVTFDDASAVSLGSPEARFEGREPEISYYRNSFDFFPDGSLLVLRTAEDEYGGTIHLRTAWWPENR